MDGDRRECRFTHGHDGLSVAGWRRERRTMRIEGGCAGKKILYENVKRKKDLWVWRDSLYFHGRGSRVGPFPW